MNPTCHFHRIVLIVENCHCNHLQKQKSRLPFPGNPAISIETRGFPSPPHGGFGFLWDGILSHENVKLH